LSGVTDPDESAPDDDAAFRDELPEDLDASAFRVEYTFPNNSRRRVPAAMYLVLGAAAAVAYLVWKDSSPLVDRGLLIAGGGLAAFGLYGMVAGRRLRIDETEALGAATRTIGFAVGHASAQLAWRGLWSRPVWRLLMYSAETPPTRRAMVIVDGITGDVVQWFSEDNPETWVDDVAKRPVATESTG